VEAHIVRVDEHVDACERRRHSRRIVEVVREAADAIAESVPGRMRRQAADLRPIDEAPGHRAADESRRAGDENDQTGTVWRRMGIARSRYTHGMPADDQDARPLQFDRVDTDQQAGEAPRAEGLACRACGAAIRTEYFSWNGAPLCETCKAALETARTTARQWSTFGRAVAFGIGATIAGA